MTDRGDPERCGNCLCLFWPSPGQDSWIGYAVYCPACFDAYWGDLENDQLRGLRLQGRADGVCPDD